MNILQRLIFWKKDQPNKKTKTIVVNELCVTFNDNIEARHSYYNWTGTNIKEPWVDFYEWYFKGETDNHLMSSPDYEVVFKKCDIKRFSVRLYNKVVDVDDPKYQ